VGERASLWLRATSVDLSNETAVVKWPPYSRVAVQQQRPPDVPGWIEGSLTDIIQRMIGVLCVNWKGLLVMQWRNSSQSELCSHRETPPNHRYSVTTAFGKP
jgi:hypothetical protein